mgnify:CR=1 FL=1
MSACCKTRQHVDASHLQVEVVHAPQALPHQHQHQRQHGRAQRRAQVGAADGGAGEALAGEGKEGGERSGGMSNTHRGASSGSRQEPCHSLERPKLRGRKKGHWPHLDCKVGRNALHHEGEGGQHLGAHRERLAVLLAQLAKGPVGGKRRRAWAVRAASVGPSTTAH